ncbi:MAG: DUF3037 domain-containing protein [Bacteroidota bacterium]|nr:DUF3037 domain-containing protein [Bacteroidota bacterium]
MQTFEYQILRFMPDRVKGEFLNLGLVIYNVENAVFDFKLNTKSNRINVVFSESNGRFIRNVLHNIQSNLDNLRDSRTDKLNMVPIKSLDNLTRMILPKDDSALYFTESEKTLDVNIESAIAYLFQRLVSVNHKVEEKANLQDKQVWSKEIASHKN